MRWALDQTVRKVGCNVAPTAPIPVSPFLHQPFPFTCSLTPLHMTTHAGTVRSVARSTSLACSLNLTHIHSRRCRAVSRDPMYAKWNVVYWAPQVIKKWTDYCAENDNRIQKLSAQSEGASPSCCYCCVLHEVYCCHGPERRCFSFLLLLLCFV